jgi:hypothetical protein
MVKEKNSLLQMAEQMTSRLEQKAVENLDPEKQKKLLVQNCVTNNIIC